MSTSESQIAAPLFGKVLVANRGEIASRVIRTCKRLGIATVAVYSEADASALFVEEADEAVPLVGSRVQDSYLSLEQLLAALKATRADAVHPGYGMLSEDPRLARAVSAAGSVFIGPSSEAMAQLGDKVTARALALQVGLRHPPGTETAIDASDLLRVRETAAQIGYPLMLKPAGGGGGIGMQRALQESEVDRALSVAVARSQAAFGDPRVYIERAIERGRHIEVQVARDCFGNTVALGDRECSVQRRHQKVLEECPSPAAFLDAERRQRFYRGAQALLDSVGYVGVATVEFLADWDREDPEIYFLEVNARIQVEHPVTEFVFGVDLVELQLQLAASRPIPESFVSAVPRGHAVEVRLYAEDPNKGYLPQPGKLRELVWPESQAHLRIDSSYRQGDTITSYYDPLIAKLICYGTDRIEALNRLERALGATRIQLEGPKGPRTTNLELLRSIVRHPQVRAGSYDTTVLE